MVNTNQSPRLLKHIIRSYARLSENSRVRTILKDNLPEIFQDKSFQNTLDEASKRYIQNIFKCLNISSVSSKTNSENEVNLEKKIK
jgi:hypothetical protein